VTGTPRISKSSSVYDTRLLASGGAIAVFEQETVHPARICGDEDAAVRDQSFVDCEIKGPAIMRPTECEFVSSSFDGALDEVFWEVPLERQRFLGVVSVERCRFENCTFTDIGIAGTKEALDKLRGELG
jgi:hypothetical protein